MKKKIQTISFIWLLGYLVEIPQWERGRGRKHPWSNIQHSEKPRKYSKTPEKRAGTSVPVLWRHFRSHPVAMLLPVMRNGTFSTTTIVRKKCGKNPGMSRTYIRDWRHFRSRHFMSYGVTSGHACTMARFRLASGDPPEIWLEPSWYTTYQQPCYPILTDVLVGHINSDVAFSRKSALLLKLRTLTAMYAKFIPI